MKRILMVIFLAVGLVGNTSFAEPPAPQPMLKANGKAVDWWFVFKFNSKFFPGCVAGAERTCAFGGKLQNYKKGFSQRYVYASSDNETLQEGGGCLGDSDADPVGATFAQVFGGNYFYVIWNDQLGGDPIRDASTDTGHSKGMLAWNENGEGFVMQVSTPSWPGTCSVEHPRTKEGNTLGCLERNNVMVSQHFFALKLKEKDLVMVLEALVNASVKTDTNKLQLVHNGGPAEIRALVARLGKKSKSTEPEMFTLSSGVELLSKPAKLHVPPWQLASAELDGEPLLAATWWTTGHKIDPTTGKEKIGCWYDELGEPGAVDIAMEGHWRNTGFSLKGGPFPNANHAKIGVSTDGTIAIFADLNQEGTLSPKPGKVTCKSSQNGRGGLFFIVPDSKLNHSIAELISKKPAATLSEK